MTKKTKKSPFDYIKDLTVNKIKNPVLDKEYLKDYEPTVINKILSMNFKMYPYLLQLNTFKCANMPKEMHFRYLHSKLPKQFFKFDYVKGKKNTAADDIKYIVEYYECNKTQAMEYCGILSKDQIKNIKNLYKTRV